nr:hypothetical protein [Tanacetum cinerariifolium]
MNTVLRGCTLGLLGRPYNIDMMPIDLSSFDVIIIMDWLAKNHPEIVCDEKIVRIPYENEILIVQGDKRDKGKKSTLSIVSCLKTQKYMEKAKDKSNYLELPIPAARVHVVAMQPVPSVTLAAHAAWELLETVRDFHACKQEEGQSVSSYVLKMNSYKDNLEHLGKVQKINKNKKSQLAARRNTKGKGTSKLAYAPKPKIPPPPKKEDHVKDSVCHHCGDTGHLKRNYPKETMGYSFYYPPENKVFVARNAKLFKNSLITQEASGSLEELELIQEEDTPLSKNTSSHHDEGDQEIDEPQSDIIPIRRSIRTRHVPDRMSLNIEDVKSYLGRCFDIKDLGEAAYILEIKIYRDRSKRLISLCQSAYIEKILKRFFMENSKRRSIPVQEKIKLSTSQGASTPAEVKRMQNIPYALAVGSIMYAVRCTRPDDAFAQNITSRFQQNLGSVDWKSTKQSFFATSSAEAEYIAASDTSKEAIWVRQFIYGLGLVPTIEEPIKMYCDNTGAITIANKSRITKGARYYRTKVHYLR